MGRFAQYFASAVIAVRPTLQICSWAICEFKQFTLVLCQHCACTQTTPRDLFIYLMCKISISLVPYERARKLSKFACCVNFWKQCTICHHHATTVGPLASGLYSYAGAMQAQWKPCCRKGLYKLWVDVNSCIRILCCRSPEFVPLFNVKWHTHNDCTPMIMYN